MAKKNSPWFKGGGLVFDSISGSNLMLNVMYVFGSYFW